jgi:hypothetical protein
MAVSNRVYRSGEIVPFSGQYAVVDANYRRIGREVTCVKGEVFPPTPASGYGYVLVDKTQHAR